MGGVGGGSGGSEGGDERGEGGEENEGGEVGGGVVGGGGEGGGGEGGAGGEEMTMEQIILLAREAGFSVTWPETVVNFARFAALIAAAEREACAVLVETLLGENPDLSEVFIAAEIRARGEND